LSHPEHETINGMCQGLTPLAGIPTDVVERLHLEDVPFERNESRLVDLLRLDGKVALVTGGGGTGLGAATCHRLAEQGASVAVLDVDGSAAQSTADAIATLYAVPTLAIMADVSDWDEVQAGVKQVSDSLGSVDILVNNAGGSGAKARDGRRPNPMASFVDMTRSEIEFTRSINLDSIFAVTHAVLPEMLGKRRGRIIMVASETGKVGGLGDSVYTACKAAQIGLTRALAYELGPKGISTVAVCPGLMLGRQHLDALRQSGGLADLLERASSRITFGRPSVADEVATAIAFLASDAGAYAHGTAISVGGGLSD
jgi:2-hydroxycyclohexanecarboxyl-CoA dehydrogenase